MTNLDIILSALGGALGFGVVTFLVTCLFVFGPTYIEERMTERKVIRNARLQARLLAIEEGDE
jgi:hypothetical protein